MSWGGSISWRTPRSIRGRLTPSLLQEMTQVFDFARQLLGRVECRGMCEPAVDIRELTKVYPSRGRRSVRALEGVTLQFERGRITSILGPNGAGKTTLVKILSGLVTPTGGEALVNGLSVTRQRRAVQRLVGAVLEGNRNAYWRLSGLENLMYFGLLRGMSPGAIRLRSRELLEQVGLWDCRDDLVKDYSRGMQQKLAVCIALLHRPPVLLLDEPTLGLDVETARHLEQYMGELAGQGTTIIITSHQLDMVQRVSHKVVMLHKGSVLAHTDLPELLARFSSERYRLAVSGGPPGDPPRHLSVRVAEDTGGSYQVTLEHRDQLHEAIRWLIDQGCVIKAVDRQGACLEEVFLALVGEETAVGKTAGR